MYGFVHGSLPFFEVSTSKGSSSTRRCRRVVVAMTGQEQPTTSSLPKVEHARDFATGRNLVLCAVTSASIPEVVTSSLLYLRCRSCQTGYRIGNRQAVLDRNVRCAACGEQWTATMTDLFLEEAKESHSNAKSSKENDEDGMEKDDDQGRLRCRHFQVCSGCTLEGGEAERSDAMDSLSRFGKNALEYSKPVRMIKGKMRGWRTLARVAVRPEHGSQSTPVIGLFRNHSHDVVAIPDCQVHHPSINICIDFVQEQLRSCGVTAFHEQTSQGMLRYIQVIVDRRSGLCQLSLVWNAASVKEAGSKLYLLAKMLWNRREDAMIESIWVAFQASLGNVILPKDRSKWKLLRGKAMSSDRFLDSIDVNFGPFSFRQANLDLFERLVSDLCRFVGSKDHVVEFCGGVGIIGLTVLRKREPKSLIVTDLNPTSEEGFLETLGSMPEELRARARFRAGSMDSFFQLATDCDVIIVDPPRSGLSHRLLSVFTRQTQRTQKTRSGSRQESGGPTSPSKQKIIYVSCGIDSFKKDTQALVQSGWKTVFLQGYLLFPGTPHVESLGVFERP